jgi:tetratricopeptide (TPR) repeat protein
MRKLLVLLIAAFPFAYPAQAQRLNADSLRALLATSTDTTRIYLLNQLAHALRGTDADQAAIYAQEAIERSQQLKFEAGEALATYRLAVAMGFKNNFDHALELLAHARDLAVQAGRWELAGDCELNIGGIYASRTNTKKAFESYTRGLEFYNTSGSKTKMASTLYAIGNTYTQEKKFEQALDYYQQSIKEFEQLKQLGEVPKVLVNVGIMYQSMGNYAQALKEYTQAIARFNNFKNERGAATALQNRAETHYTLQQYTEALADLEASMVLNERNHHEFNKAKCSILFGKIYRAQKKYDLAIAKLETAIAITKKIKLTQDTGEAYRLLAEVSSERGDFRKAYEFQQLYRIYYDSVFDKEKSRQLQELQIAFETEKKEAEIRDLKNQQRLSRTYMLGAFMLLALVALIAFLILNRQRLKIKKDKELAEKENQLLEERKALMDAEAQNQKLNEEKLKRDLEFKNKELTTYTLNLIQKNEVLEKIKEAVEEIRHADETQMRTRLNGLVNTVNYSLHLDKDWENFRLHFEQVHQSFFDRLRELFPDLSANDMKLCALIRLNLDTKETAAVLDISPESAKVARHRLRKKLNLASEQNLAAFLATIG